MGVNSSDAVAAADELIRAREADKTLVPILPDFTKIQLIKFCENDEIKRLRNIIHDAGTKISAMQAFVYRVYPRGRGHWTHLSGL